MDLNLNFGKHTTVYLSEELSTKVDEALKKNPERFANKSHFFRIAVLKLLREEKIVE